jgi:acetyl esterase/lipase
MNTHIIVLPGGGYRRHAAHEGEPVATWLRGLGLSASVLHYPVDARHPAPLDAIRNAIRDRRRAGAERIGLCGFSAGGHAAGLAALAAGATGDARVDGVILGYPVVSMLHDPHVGSRERLLGADPAVSEAAEVSLERLVHPGAPPFFVWHTAEDSTVSVEHSLLLLRALWTHGVPDCELHVFPVGAHGLGLAEGTASGAWRSLTETWLRALAWIPPAPTSRR